MNFKGILWKYITAFVVLLIILNPELAELALFVDAIGLEMFVMLLEVHIIAILGEFLNSKVKPVYVYIKHLCFRRFPIESLKNIKEKPGSLMLVAPSTAILMNALVFLAAIKIAFNVH